MKLLAGVLRSWNGSTEPFWGDEEQHKKVHPIAWSDICKDKDEGGLAIRILKYMNKSFLAKLAERYLMEAD